MKVVRVCVTVVSSSFGMIWIGIRKVSGPHRSPEGDTHNLTEVPKGQFMTIKVYVATLI